MNTANFLPWLLSTLLLSFFITSLLVVPFINLLYQLRLTRRKEAPKKGKVPLFDKLHDKKAGTPVGGGILIIVIVGVMFALFLLFARSIKIDIRSAYGLSTELLLFFLHFFLSHFWGFLTT